MVKCQTGNPEDLSFGIPAGKWGTGSPTEICGPLEGSTLRPRARICKRLRRPGIDSEVLIPPAYAALRAGTTNRVVTCCTGPSGWESILGLLKRSANTGPGKLQSTVSALTIGIVYFILYQFRA